MSLPILAPKRPSIEITNASILSGNDVIMFVYDYIGENPKTKRVFSGEYFSEEMYYHKSMGRNVTAYINSPGGSVYEMYAMFQAIIDTESNTHIVGMAASAAGMLAQAGKKRTANDFAVLMIHGVSNGDSDLLKITGQRLRNVLAKRSKMTIKQIDAMMAPDAPNTWMDSSQMWEMGLIDEKPVDTGVKSPVNSNNFSTGVASMTDSYNLYSQLVNSLTLPTQKITPMLDKVLLATLGLPENADLTTVLAKINELKATANTVKASEAANVLLAAVNAANQQAAQPAAAQPSTVEAELKALKTQRATDLVENAVKAGKIAETAKTKFLELATNHYDLAKETIDGIAAKPADGHNSVMNVISPTATGTETTEKETYEWLAVNDPKKLQNIAEKDPAKFEKLASAHSKMVVQP